MNLLVSVARKVFVQKTKIATTGILHSASFRKNDADQV